MLDDQNEPRFAPRKVNTLGTTLRRLPNSYPVISLLAHDCLVIVYVCMVLLVLYIARNLVLREQMLRYASCRAFVMMRVIMIPWHLLVTLSWGKYPWCSHPAEWYAQAEANSKDRCTLLVNMANIITMGWLIAFYWRSDHWEWVFRVPFYKQNWCYWFKNLECP